MPSHLLVVERDPGDRTVWRYGLADAEGRLPPGAPRLWHDPVGGASGPLDEPHPLDFASAVCLVRLAGHRDRLVHDLTLATGHGGEPPPAGPAPGWRRATDGRAKEAGETLGARTRRDRTSPPRPTDRFRLRPAA